MRLIDCNMHNGKALKKSRSKFAQQFSPPRCWDLPATMGYETLACASAGGDAAVDDLPVGPLETIDAASSHAMSDAMFVADFASTFHQPLALPRIVNFRQLQDAIAAEGELEGREVLWELYEGLMRFLLNVSPNCCLLSCGL